MNLEHFLLYSNDEGSAIYPMEDYEDAEDKMIALAKKYGDHSDEIDCYYCWYENDQWYVLRWNGDMFSL